LIRHTGGRTDLQVIATALFSVRTQLSHGWPCECQLKLFRLPLVTTSVFHKFHLALQGLVERFCSGRVEGPLPSSRARPSTKYAQCQMSVPIVSLSIHLLARLNPTTIRSSIWNSSCIQFAMPRHLAGLGIALGKGPRASPALEGILITR